MTLAVGFQGENFSVFGTDLAVRSIYMDKTIFHLQEKAVYNPKKKLLLSGGGSLYCNIFLDFYNYTLEEILNAKIEKYNHELGFYLFIYDVASAKLYIRNSENKDYLNSPRQFLYNSCADAIPDLELAKDNEKDALSAASAIRRYMLSVIEKSDCFQGHAIYIIEKGGVQVYSRSEIPPSLRLRNLINFGDIPSKERATERLLELGV